MSKSPHTLDTFRCKHCGAVVALLPRASVVGRFSLRCQECGVMLVVWPLDPKKRVDIVTQTAYTEFVPV